MVGDLLLIATSNTVSNTDTLTLLLPVMIGGAIGIAGSLATTLVAHPLQMRRERVAHTTSLEENSDSVVYKSLEQLISSFANYVAGLRHDIDDPASYSATKRGEQERQIDHEIEQFSTLLW